MAAVQAHYSAGSGMATQQADRTGAGGGAARGGKGPGGQHTRRCGPWREPADPVQGEPVTRPRLPLLSDLLQRNHHASKHHCPCIFLRFRPDHATPTMKAVNHTKQQEGQFNRELATDRAAHRRRQADKSKRQK